MSDLPKYLLSVDPGTRITGVAWWVDGILTAAENLRERTPYQQVTAVSDFVRVLHGRAQSTGSVGASETMGLVIEFPEVYARWSNKDPNDLLTLAALCGAIDHEMHRIFDTNTWKYLPKEYKGQLKKTVTKNRCLAILSDQEKQATGLREAGKALDVWDSIYLGLHHLGRHLP